MSNYYYIVTTTTDENAGIVEAESKEQALELLDTTYTPNDAMRKSKLVSFKLVDKGTYDRASKQGMIPAISAVPKAIN